MNVCGIISEYNPFHYGHLHHIKKTRELTQCDILVNVMSGNFVQRGEPAIINKWSRAEEAIRQGCDIVIELPLNHVLQNADQFANGAIQTLVLANVQTLVFGSESNNIDELLLLSNQSSPPNKSVSLASSSIGKSNDILGVSYLKALRDTPIRPYTIQRTNNYHDSELKNKIASASAIRKGFYEGKDVNAYTPMANQLMKDFQLDAYYPFLQQLLMIMDKNDLHQIFLMEEGIENLLCANAKQYDNINDFINHCISRKYTRSRIQRTLMHILMQNKKSMMQALPPLKHIRILAFNKKGQQYLKILKKQDVEIVSRFNQLPTPFQSLYLKSTAAYAIPLTPDRRIAAMKQEVRSPIQVIL